jgi:hypothetical protein
MSTRILSVKGVGVSAGAVAGVLREALTGVSVREVDYEQALEELFSGEENLATAPKHGEVVVCEQRCGGELYSVGVEGGDGVDEGVLREALEARGWRIS